MSKITSRWLDEPPPGPITRSRLAAATIVAFCILALRACWTAPAPAGAPPPTTTARDSAQTAMIIAAPAAAAAASSVPPALAAVAATPTTRPVICPTPVPTPDGVLLIYLARAADCTDLIQTSIGGAPVWIARPLDLADAIYNQLPEEVASE